MIATLVRLAFSGLRTRALASAITVVLAATATATIVVALEVGATAHDPWQRTFDAANGAHVLTDASTAADAREIASRPGVAEASTPVPLALVDADLPLEPDRMLLAGLDAAPTVNVPIVIDGVGVPGAGIVLEHSFADVLGFAVGDTVRFDPPTGRLDLQVVGTAIVPSQNRFPRENPGVGWVSRASLETLQPDPSEWNWQVGVRLADPSTDRAFADDV